MRRRSVEPAGSRRADLRRGLAAPTPTVAAAFGGSSVDAQPFEEHRRTRERRLSGRCRIIGHTRVLVAVTQLARLFEPHANVLTASG